MEVFYSPLLMVGLTRVMTTLPRCVLWSCKKGRVKATVSAAPNPEHTTLVKAY